MFWRKAALAPACEGSATSKGSARTQSAPQGDAAGLLRRKPRSSATCEVRATNL